MTVPFSIAEHTLQKLDDPMWRRLGVTQTFERLLVSAAISAPGPSDTVASRAGACLSGGGAKFWDLSRSQLERDLIRRRVLIQEAGILQAHPEFAERLNQVLSDHETGVSRVAPTPGNSVEEITRQAEARERAKAAQKPRSTRSSSGRSTSALGSARPMKRSSASVENDDPLGAQLARPSAPESVRASAPVTPAKQLFTTNRVNKLLNHLDDTTLNIGQLGKRLELSKTQLNRFLGITNGLQITRVSTDNLVDLHWRGRELVRTTSADRRMTVINLVKELRDTAEKEDA